MKKDLSVPLNLAFLSLFPYFAYENVMLKMNKNLLPEDHSVLSDELARRIVTTLFTALGGFSLLMTRLRLLGKFQKFIVHAVVSLLAYSPIEVKNKNLEYDLNARKLFLAF